MEISSLSPDFLNFIVYLQQKSIAELFIMLFIFSLVCVAIIYIIIETIKKVMKAEHESEAEKNAAEVFKNTIK